MLNLVGFKLVEFAGTSGSPTLPAGTIILQIITHASANGASVQLLSGVTVPVINGANSLYIINEHLLMTKNSGSSALTFTNTDQYYVQALVPGNV